MALRPLEGNRDEEVRRLQDYILNSIEPRIPGVQVHAIPASDGFFMLVRVPQSWAGPHRVNTNQHFYTRENGRKRTLDVPEIRTLFLRSQGLADRIRDFRTERLGRIIAGETPHPVVPNPLQIIHFVPTQAALGLMNIDPVPYATSQRLLPQPSARGNPRLNADGVVSIRNPEARGTHGYAILFRNGFYESVKTLWKNEDGRFILYSLGYEEELIKLLKEMRKEYESLGFSAELTCMLSIHRANEVWLGLDRNRFELDDDQGKFDRSTLALAEILIPADVPAEQALRPLFDLVWQSAGLIRSFNYTAAGEWAPRS